MAKKAKVWEGIIRLNHWALAFAVLGLFITAKIKFFSQHIILGKIVLGLVIFRILWGFVGSHQTRIVTGIRSLFKMRSYKDKLLSKKPEYTTGHTPFGWAMTFALLLALGTQALLGLSMEKIYNGVVYGHELSPLFTSVELKNTFHTLHHDVMPKIIIALVVLHIGAVFWYLWRKKQNLIPAMMSGKKMVDVAPTTNFKKLIIPSIIVVALAVAIVFTILNLPQLLGLTP